MNASGSPPTLAPVVRWLLVVMGTLGFVGCEKVDHFRIRGSAAASLTNDDLVSLQRIAGAASRQDGRVWGVYATHAANFDNKRVTRACVVTKFTHRDNTIAIAECVVCYKAAPGYLAAAQHRDGAWGSFEKSAERCVFVSVDPRPLNFDDLPSNPVLVRGDVPRSDIVAIIRSHSGFTGTLDPCIEAGTSPDQVILNRTLILRRRGDGTWSPAPR